VADLKAGLGKVAVVTGALSGIGRATAIAFARNGVAVFAAGRDPDAGQALERLIREGGGEATFVRTDIRDEAQVCALIELALRRHGRVDHAANCAGTDGVSTPIVDQTPDGYAAMFDTNVLGTLLAMKHELRVMRDGDGGSIVNVSSTMSRVGRAGLAAYAASKSAVEGLTKVGAIEGAAFGVRVNAIAPGPIDTPMLERVASTRGGKAAISASIPLRRAGRPEEAADLILYLCSARASYVTGQSVAIDGGRLAC